MHERLARIARSTQSNACGPETRAPGSVHHLQAGRATPIGAAMTPSRERQGNPALHRLHVTWGGGDKRRHATAPRPFFATSVNSFNDAPRGRFSPRSHWLTRLVVTLR